MGQGWQDVMGRVPACASVTDLAGSAPDAVIALHLRFDCAVAVVDLQREGRFVAPADSTLQPWMDAVIAGGVAPDRIRVIRDPADLQPADVVLALGNFGDRWKIKHLAPVLGRMLHADSLLFADIRKGSGAIPFLKAFGRTEIVTELQGQDLRRVVMRPDPPEAAGAEPGHAPEGDDWATLAARLAGPDGFVRHGPGGHSFLHVPRDPAVLVVTFDNLDIAMTKRADRRPWGYDFIERQGWSMLGVLAGGWTWYREAWVSAEFDRLRDAGFFARFGRVVFYGASMGGYAAAAFSAASPGADVVAISPQSTLDRALVPFETRYHTAWGYDYSGPYGDAAEASRSARRVTLLYDPHEPLDAGHAARFTGANVVRLRCPLMGHRLGSSLSQMGILSPVILQALAGELQPAGFYRALRARHGFPRYQRELFLRALARGRPGLARRVGNWVLARGEHRAIRRAMADLPD